MTGTVWFDMDGTIVDFYGVEGWLEMLRAFDATPYRIAKPLVNMSKLARRIHKVQASGRRAGIVSWSSKVSTIEFDKAVEQAKASWLGLHIPSVSWDEFHVVPYGTPKSSFILTPFDILFDDEERHRTAWTAGQAYTPEQIFDIL